MQAQVSAEKKHVTGYEEEVAHVRRRAEENAKVIAGKENEIKALKAEIEATSQSLKARKQEKDDAGNQRK
jgi:hypothetical protein